MLSGMSTKRKIYPMSKLSRREYLAVMRRKYKRAKKKERGDLLHDVVEITGYHRTYAAALLRSPPARKNTARKRQAEYLPETKRAVVTLWRAANCICAERLHPFMPDLLDKLAACGELTVPEHVREQLLRISLATVKRIVSQAKRKDTVRIGGTTKPGSLLKRQITVRYGRWDETTPGWCETDTVAHCGETLAGTFVYSLNVVDICSGWSEQIAILGKGERACVAGVEQLRLRLPFPLLGLDSDNGSEFINWHMQRYAKKNHITFTRSRPYKKNDNAHVEQKNWTAIRQLVGYERYDNQEQLNMLNELYAKAWRLYVNFFQPTMKLRETTKDQQTGKKTKCYYEAKTPYQRLMEHPDVTPETKAVLQSTYDSLNPVALQAEIQRKLTSLRGVVGKGSLMS